MAQTSAEKRIQAEVCVLKLNVSPETAAPIAESLLPSIRLEPSVKREIPPLTRGAANSLNLLQASTAEIASFLFLSGGRESKMSKEAYCGIGNIEEKLYENNGGVTER